MGEFIQPIAQYAIYFPLKDSFEDFCRIILDPTFLDGRTLLINGGDFLPSNGKASVTIFQDKGKNSVNNAGRLTLRKHGGIGKRGDISKLTPFAYCIILHCACSSLGQLHN